MPLANLVASFRTWTAPFGPTDLFVFHCAGAARRSPRRLGVLEALGLLPRAVRRPGH